MSDTDRFDSYADFTKLPIVERGDIQENWESFCLTRSDASEIRFTGGSTGSPLCVPWTSEMAATTRKNQTLGRLHHGVSPGERVSLLWGHTLQLEGNLRRVWLEVKRGTIDKILGYDRMSAYDLSGRKLSEAFSRICRFKPKLLYGYSSALSALVHANADLSNQAKMCGIVACVATAEPLGGLAGEAIGDFFGCPIVREYGSIETGVIAYTSPKGGGRYYVFTDTHLVEALPTDVPGVYDVVVTLLFLSGLPLVRYKLGDQVRICDPMFMGGPVVTFDEVIGRSNDNLILPDGAKVHSEAVTHALRTEREILFFQFRQFENGTELRIVVRPDTNFHAVEMRVTERLRRIHIDLGRTVIKQVAEVETTLAGKRRWIVRE